MTTRHLSISLTAYDQDLWSVALIQQTCEPGRPARSDQLEVKWGSRRECVAVARAHIQTMVFVELTRKNAGRGGGVENASTRPATPTPQR